VAETPARPDPANPLDRESALARMRSEEFDLAIIGGGINGAAVARDGALRGLSVALIERGDFAGATSSRSSKLIHGGFRYLPQGRLRLVYDALRERERLRRVTAPHLVGPIRFLFPVYRGRGFGRLTMAMGLWLYDHLGGISPGERHQNLSAARVREMEPALSREGLSGGALYYDAWGDDARLTFENVLDASLHGAAAANYLAVEHLEKSGGRVCAASIRDLARGAGFELRARVFVNAAGPWVDELRRMDDPAAPPCVRLTKGVHLVFARSALPVHDALVLADEAGRIVFVMPHDRYVLVGTTDTDYDADPAAVAADTADIAYLFAVLEESLPGIKLSGGDVLSSLAGLRALIRDGDGDGACSPSAVSREELVLESRSSVLTVAGGKLTTHREIAEKVVERAMKKLGRSPGPCPTLTMPLPGARPPGAGAEQGAAALSALAPEAQAIVCARHGSRAGMVAMLVGERPELAKPLVPGCPAIGAEVIHAARREMATSLADFMVRRTALIWRAPLEAEAAAPLAAELMGRELGWDHARIAREAAEFAADLRRRRAPA
jgi:glycerol-3-phosphate dehydrogenase